MLSNQTRPEYFPQVGFPSAYLASFPFPSVCTSVYSWRDWDPEGEGTCPRSHRGWVYEFWLQPRLSQKHPNNPGLEAECVAASGICRQGPGGGRLSWIEPNVMTRVLVKEIRECQRQRRRCKDRSRGCSDVAASHRIQAAGNGKGANSPGLSEDAHPYQHLRFSPVGHASDFWAPRTVRW